MKKKKIPWHQEKMRYSIFFGILTLISLIGTGYIHYSFHNLFFSKITFFITLVFLVFYLYWIFRERKE
jgi:Ca2+/Na+ antiporter